LGAGDILSITKIIIKIISIDVSVPTLLIERVLEIGKEV
jgi:hypothetical protein